MFDPFGALDRRAGCHTTISCLPDVRNEPAIARSPRGWGTARGNALMNCFACSVYQHPPTVQGDSARRSRLRSPAWTPIDRPYAAGARLGRPGGVRPRQPTILDASPPPAWSRVRPQRLPRPFHARSVQRVPLKCRYAMVAAITSMPTIRYSGASVGLPVDGIHLTTPGVRGRTWDGSEGRHDSQDASSGNGRKGRQWRPPARSTILTAAWARGIASRWFGNVGKTWGAER